MRYLGYVCLMLVVVAQATAQVWTPPELPEEDGIAARPALVSVTVNCGAGQRIQDAVDANPSPVEILISGICVENVLIRDKDVSLRGINKPSLDGIRSTLRSTPALIVRGPVEGTIQNLSFSESAGTAVSVRGANLVFTNCIFENNGITGLQVTLDGNVTASGLAFAGNVGRAIGVTDSQLFCTACDISGSSFAVLANRGAIVSLLDSVVTGGRGIAAVDGGTLADLDCVTLTTAHPCSMTVTGVAAQAVGGGTAVIVGAGDFTGQLVAFDQGTVEILGSRQNPILGGSPANVADFFGKIVVAAFPDVDPPLQSRVRSTTASHFSQVLVTDSTIVDGTVTVSSASQVYFDPTVIARPPR